MATITNTTSIVVNGVPRALSGGFVVNGITVLSSANAVFVYKYDGTTTLDSSDDMYLTDSISNENILLKTSAGLKFNGVNQSSKTNGVSGNGTLLFDMLSHNGDRESSLIFTNNDFIKTNSTNGELRVRFRYAGEKIISTTPGVSTYFFRPCIVKTTTEATVYHKDFQTIINTPDSRDVISGAYGICAMDNAYYFAENTFKGIWYFKDYFFTPEQYQAHLLSPEKTIYFDSEGNLTSDVITDSSYLASLPTNGSYVYLFTENENAGAVITNILNGTTSVISNYDSVNHTMRSNALYDSKGIQTALLEQDINGLPTGISDIDVEATSLSDAQSQFLSENNLTLIDNLGQLEITK